MTLSKREKRINSGTQNIDNLFPSPDLISIKLAPMARNAASGYAEAKRVTYPNWISISM